MSTEGKQYRDSIFYLSREFRGLFKLKERLSVHIQAYPPDKRRRDLDNILKSLLDSLQYAQVYEDDSQIDFLAIKRMMDFYGKIIVDIIVL